jgi:hypothetical protein
MVDILIGALAGLVVSLAMWAPYIIITDWRRRNRHKRY